jgi:4'-phosphopantetheinyl transferase
MQGKLIFNRPDQKFTAGFCFIKADAPEFADKSLLHPKELSYYYLLRSTQRRLSYLLGRTASKKAIGELIGSDQLASIFIDVGVFDFPVARVPYHANIQVSISHSRDIAVALAFPEEHPLAVDIERIDPDYLEAIESIVSEKEKILLSVCGLDIPTGYTMLWTAKESLSKVIRTGLMLEFDLMEVLAIENLGSCYVLTFLHFSQYKVITLKSDSLICSIVCPKNSMVICNDFGESFALAARTMEA